MYFNRREEIFLDFFFSKTHLRPRRKSCQYVFNELALSHPEAPSQRASNLFEEGAPIHTICYLLIRAHPNPPRPLRTLPLIATTYLRSTETETLNSHSHGDPDLSSVSAPDSLSLFQLC